MKENLESLNRKLLVKAMKTIFFIIPIGLITKNLFVMRYGEFKIEFVEYYKYIKIEHILFSVIVFCLIFLFSYTIEKFVLPTIITSVSRKINKSIFDNANLKTTKVLKNKYGFNPYSKIRKNEANRDYLFTEFMYFPVTITLWLIGINTLLSYLMIILVIIFSIYFFNIIYSFLEHYKIK